MREQYINLLYDPAGEELNTTFQNIALGLNKLRLSQQVEPAEPCSGTSHRHRWVCTTSLSELQVEKGFKTAELQQ